MKFDEAMKSCVKLGEGWRLPTRNELNILYENKNKIGGFGNYTYWSSTEFDINYACYQYFLNGTKSNNQKVNLMHVRAIKFIDGEQTQNKSTIVGDPIKIGNLLVAQNDFLYTNVCNYKIIPKVKKILLLRPLPANSILL